MEAVVSESLFNKINIVYVEKTEFLFTVAITVFSFVVIIHLYLTCHHRVYLFYLPHSNVALSVRRVTAKMIVRALALVFLFLLKINKFPANKSVAEIIRKRYGSEAVKWLRKFEKLNFKIRKNKFTKIVFR